MTNNKMHDDELNIDEVLVTKLLKQQFPRFAELNVKQIIHSGTENAIFLLGTDKCVRLPRIASANENIEKEQAWLPKLASHLPLAIPNPLENGNPGNDYPYHWYIYQWIEGMNAHDKKPTNLEQTANDLAHFINTLHNIPTDGAPIARRGLPLATQDVGVRKSILDLKDTIDVDIITSIWDECLHVPEWNKPPVWLHGDLLPSNMIIQNDRLHAIIDFGLMGIGDPACDLIPAWNLFDYNSREVFRNELNIDDNSWARAKGWALSIALIIIPYYKDSNPVLVSVADRMIKEILLSHTQA